MIEFPAKNTAIMDIENSNCDHWNKCDTYIRLIVDDTELSRTRTVMDNDHPIFREKFIHTVCHDSKIRIEMRDKDGFLQGDDDLIWFGQYNNVYELGEISNNYGHPDYRGHRNYLKIKASFSELNH